MLKTIYLLELKQLLRKKIAVLLFVFLVLALYFVQNGVNRFATISENKKQFQEFEGLKIRQYQTLTQYGTYGWRILFVPSPLSILFVNSGTITEPVANVDSGERMQIYNSFKGRALFVEKSGGFKDFSGIMLLLGSLLALYLGYESMAHKDYLRFMTSFFGCRKLFLSILLSRLLSILLFFLFLMAAALALIRMNGLHPWQGESFHLVIYLAALETMILFFFLLGTIAGCFKSRFTGLVTLLAAWFVLVFFIPGAVSTFTYNKAGNIISNYLLELEKLKRIMEIEKSIDEKIALEEENKKEQLRKELMEYHLDKGLKKILALEEQLEKEMDINVSFFHKLSIFFPSTFYLATGNEISSKGYENFIAYFRHVRKLKYAFIKFYVAEKFRMIFLKAKFPEKKIPIKSFVKNNENLFFARSRLPEGFQYGFLLNLTYIVLLCALAYRLFKKSLKL
ncbi:MAG: hypothetical protein GY757_44860 [bacterium]|nr:hypothetical protein [bacterium]